MRTPELKILVGATGAGKSTFAKYWLQTEPNWMRVSRDDFRAMHFSKDNMNWEDEQRISEMIDGAITQALQKGINILIDATHCKSAYINSYITKFNHKANISFKVFDVPLEILKKRCKSRFEETGKHIPEKVVEKFFNELEQLKKNFDFNTRIKTQQIFEFAEQNPDLPKALICDLDGTLSLLNGRNPFDASRCDEDLLNVPVANILKNYYAIGHQILLVSGREDRYREPTMRFLEKHNIPYSALWMRQTNDNRKDSIIKREIYSENIHNQYYIEFVLDDRNQVVDTWRQELKLTCLQVNYGDF